MRQGPASQSPPRRLSCRVRRPQSIQCTGLQSAGDLPTYSNHDHGVGEHVRNHVVLLISYHPYQTVRQCWLTSHYVHRNCGWGIKVPYTFSHGKWKLSRTKHQFWASLKISILFLLISKKGFKMSACMSVATSSVQIIFQLLNSTLFWKK